MVGRLLWVNALALLLVMTGAWVIAVLRRRLDTVDMAWGVAFVVTAWVAFWETPHGLNLLVAIMVTAWGLRLASHIYERSQFRGDDPRYNELTRKWQGNIWRQAYFRIFLLQGALVWIISLPVVLLANRELSGAGEVLTIGALIWLVGFIIEAFADRQLLVFLRDPDHPRVMQGGLWHYSRHPNYFGELLQWWGFAVMALATSFGWVGLLGPVLLSYLIVFVSGLPPIENRRKDDPDYQAYKRRTSALLPLPPAKHEVAERGILEP